MYMNQPTSVLHGICRVILEMNVAEATSEWASLCALSEVYYPGAKFENHYSNIL